MNVVSFQDVIMHQLAAQLKETVYSSTSGEKPEIHSMRCACGRFTKRVDLGFLSPSSFINNAS